MLPRQGGFAIMLQETGIATRAQEMHVAAALRDKGYTPFFSSRRAETGATSTSRRGGLLTAASSKYVAEHEVLSFTEIVPGKAVALRIRTDGGGLTLINVHGPQAGCSPWAGRAAFWADIQMYATARSLGGRHPVVIAGDTNIYMDATLNPATEHFRAGWEARGLRKAAAGGKEDMTPTLHGPRGRSGCLLLAVCVVGRLGRGARGVQGVPRGPPCPPLENVRGRLLVLHRACSVHCVPRQVFQHHPACIVLVCTQGAFRWFCAPSRRRERHRLSDGALSRWFEGQVGQWNRVWRQRAARGRRIKGSYSGRGPETPDGIALRVCLQLRLPVRGADLAVWFAPPSQVVEGL